MTYIVYILYLVAAALLCAAIWRLAVGERTQAFGLVVAGVACAILGATLSWRAIGGEVNARGYARVKAAASRSSEADAMAQWALEDNRITLSEYAVIADAYRRQTGRDINEEKTR